MKTYLPLFIAIREAPATSCHATLRADTLPWKSRETCTCTSGPLHAAEAVLRKAGYPGHQVELVPKDQWTDATNGYLSSSRRGFTPTAISHIYRVCRP